MIKELAMAGMLALTGCAPYFVAVNQDHDCKEIREVSPRGRKLNVSFATSNGIRKELLDIGECASNIETKMSKNHCGVHVRCRDVNNGKVAYYYSLESKWPDAQRFYVNFRQRR